MIKNIISRLTMIKLSEEGFWDNISDKKVYYWQDYYFDCYVASSRFSVRIKINIL